MADKELATLSSAGSLTGSSLYVVDADGNSRKVSFAALKAAINETPLSSIPYRGARARRTTNQAFGASAAAKVSFSSADYDTDSIWNIASPTRLTVPTGVTRVRLAACMDWASAAAGTRIGLFYKNGSAAFPGNGYLVAQSVGSTAHRMQILSDALTVVAGDYFELEGFTTTAINLQGGNFSWAAMQILEG